MPQRLRMVPARNGVNERTTQMYVTYIKNGKVIRRKIPRDATKWNGPLIPMWNNYDALGRPSDMFQDSWGRLCKGASK